MTLLLAATLLAVAFPDVAPIIEKRCVSCHQPGEIAPMAFTSYEEVRPWAKGIRAAVIGEIQAAVVRGSRKERPHGQQSRAHAQ